MTERRTFHVTVRAKNNLLLSRRKEYGFTMQKMAVAIGVPLYIYSAYENMQRSPLGKDGIILPHAQAVLNFFDLPFEELWPEEVLKIKHSKAVLELDAIEIKQMLYDRRPALPDKVLEKRDTQRAIRKVLSTLTPREEKILRMRYGLDGRGGKTLEEVGEDFEVAPERIRQIECKGLRKLRHPSKSKTLYRDYWED